MVISSCTSCIDVWHAPQVVLMSHAADSVSFSEHTLSVAPSRLFPISSPTDNNSFNSYLIQARNRRNYVPASTIGMHIWQAAVIPLIGQRDSGEISWRVGHLSRGVGNHEETSASGALILWRRSNHVARTRTDPHCVRGKTTKPSRPDYFSQCERPVIQTVIGRKLCQEYRTKSA